MQVDGPVNQSPQSFASSIYSLPKSPEASALGVASNACQPDFVPTPSCYAHGLDISLPHGDFSTLELNPPPFDLVASAQLTPDQLDDLELLAAFYETTSDAPATVKPATAEAEGEVAKHKTLFGRRGYLDRERAREAAMLKREPNPKVPHKYNLLFITLVSALIS